MNWLLDTNVCIAVLNGRPDMVYSRLREASLRRDSLAVSAISVFELHYGVTRSSRVAANDTKLSIFLAPLTLLPALRHDLVLVTANVAEFARVPSLRIENWAL